MGPKAGLETDVPVEREEQEGKRGSIHDRYPPKSPLPELIPTVNTASTIYSI